MNKIDNISNVWCGTHTYFDDNCNPIIPYSYIEPKIRNTGIGSYNLWCGTHTYFDDEGNPLVKIPYIEPKVRNTGIGSYNLWCGKHTYFSDEDEEFEADKEEKYIPDPLNDYQIHTEETHITVFDLEEDEEYIKVEKKDYPIYNID